MTKYDVAIIGAGPAGIMAAISASENGKRVLLIEKNDQIGRKILATGNGRCNLTNRNIKVERFHGATPSFVSSVIAQFDQNKTIKFFEDLGLMLKEEDRGRIFPRTNQASSVVEILEYKLKENNVEILLNATVKKISKDTNWNLLLEDGRNILSDRLIIATGGKAAHYLGSSGDGLFWARNMGHTVSSIYAALVPVETQEAWTKDVSGVKVEAKVWTTSNGEMISDKYGDLLFTHFGLSGPVVMSQSRFIAPLVEQKEVKIHIDLFNDISEEVLAKNILRNFEMNGKKAVKNCLVGLIPQRLISIILMISGVDGERKAAEVSREGRMTIAKTLKDLTLTVKSLRPLKEAQVTAGGIVCDEINSGTLESLILPGLYFAGEIIDVDADSGGFNLQWAWSSGYVAGKFADRDS